MRGLGRYYQLEVTCHGPADPVTGYSINIRDIDQAVRAYVVPGFEQWVAQTPHTDSTPMGTLMRQTLERLQPALHHQVDRVKLELTPMHSLEIRSCDMDQVILRQQYEFSAAHRLHAAALSDAENRQVFGKCNNPAGHGHNYLLEVAVRAAVHPDGRVLMIEDLDALVDEAVIQKLDHKYLNVDVPQFADLNPSVENIAKVIYELLEPRIGELDDTQGVALEAISVWETAKTVCTYRGPVPAGTETVSNRT